ncbi:hypothetical protein SAMN05444000_1066 [Shimia gijangensis]|uniref:Uncharacterized protein n=1 Tax=Shimia gijangensis TaxID=1470563 RepID=A0A1M6HBM4_9RHOB|nr:hypothetical protein [Shimia gijangensis]SHJ19591.1 hypothetical protein SAMN05444000_1066 [Shimia gijangensis]
MFDIFRSKGTAAEQASPELRKLKSEFAEAENLHKAASEQIRKIRSRANPSNIPPGSPMDRRRKPVGLSARDSQALEAAVKQRTEVREKIEELKGQIASANTAAMQKICADTRPEYSTHLKKLWSSRLAQIQEEIVAVENLERIRMGLEAQQVRLTGLPPYSKEQRELAERSKDLCTEVVELLEDGALTRRDIPKALLTAWRIK